MKQFLRFLVCGSVALSQISAASGQSARLAGLLPSVKLESGSSNPAGLPALPPGKSTILGGEIRDVDPVQDRFLLQVFGQRPMKILFDERTEVYRDGIRVPLRDLGQEDHASVQTVLDGTDVFALSVHALSHAPEGECRGAVLQYRPADGILTVAASLSGTSVQFLVPADISIARQGQSNFTASHPGLSDLVKGSLVSVTFQSGKNGKGVASQITVLAVPGSQFVLAGRISSLDIHSRVLVLVDPRDQKSYQVFLDGKHFQTMTRYHLGDLIRVVATFDGGHYLADEITSR